jgi:hypothetical protein
MGKSFRHEKDYSNSKSNKNEFKRKRNQLKNESVYEEYSEYSNYNIRNLNKNKNEKY